MKDQVNHLRIVLLPPLLVAVLLVGCESPQTDSADLATTTTAVATTADATGPNVSASEKIESASQESPEKGKPEMTNDPAREKSSAAGESSDPVVGAYNKLSAAEIFVILEKGTEPPSEGGYTMTKDPGTYICRQCNSPLYQARDKFESHCGWPSFDDEIKGAVTRHPDADGYRVEIVCSNCGGHLGHVFQGERLTAKDTRHCVNSISMTFIKEGGKIPPMILAEKQD